MDKQEWMWVNLLPLSDEAKARTNLDTIIGCFIMLKYKAKGGEQLLIACSQGALENQTPRALLDTD
jgi:hypothetical protein